MSTVVENEKEGRFACQEALTSPLSVLEEEVASKQVGVALGMGNATRLNQAIATKEENRSTGGEGEYSKKARCAGGFGGGRNFGGGGGYSDGGAQISGRSRNLYFHWALKGHLSL